LGGDPVIDAAALGLQVLDDGRLVGLGEFDDLIRRVAVGLERQAGPGGGERQADAATARPFDDGGRAHSSRLRRIFRHFRLAV
jgi:hypothetical protein